MSDAADSRRRFIAGIAQLGLGASLLPEEVFAQEEKQGSHGPELDAATLKSAAAVAGLEFSDAELQGMVQAVNQNLGRIRELHAIHIPNDVAPPFYFSPIVPGMQVNRAALPFRLSKPAASSRPQDLEEVAFWPVTALAELLKARAVTSVELTQMYLARLKKHNEKINCVVTFLDDVAMAHAKQADAEIGAGRYKGPLHGVPWGAKDIIAVKGYKTTWGSGAYREQVIDEEGSVIALLRDAGAVLLAKLTTGELAGGDQWFGGRTNNPWDLKDGASGSSAGPASATAAGLVPFAIGTETGGSILSPSARCGATGLRPTFGRVSRHGVMALAWSQDRLGPICRYVEDCAVVMSVIARPDGKDLSVSDIPFNWDGRRDYRTLRVGYLADAFTDKDRNAEWIRNDQASLEQLRSMGVKLVKLFTRRFPDRFPVDAAGKPTTDHIATLVEMTVNPSLVPDKVTLRDFPQVQAEGEGKYMFDVYLRKRGDSEIKSNTDLINKATFYNDAHFPDRKRTRETADRAMELNTADRMLRRFAVQEVILQCMEEQHLDAVTYPMTNIPPGKLDAPQEPNVNGRSPLGWTLLGAQGFPAITVPAGFTTQVYDRVRDPTVPRPPTPEGASPDAPPPEATRLVGPVAAKLPVGVGFLARPFDEAILFRIASAYTAATRHRMPPPEFGPIPGEP